MFKNKRKMVLMLIVLIFIIFLILGLVGYYYNLNQTTDAKPSKNSQDESTSSKNYYENLKGNMNLYFTKNGYFVETNYCNDGSVIKSKIDNNFNLYLSVDFNADNYVSTKVLLVDVFCNDYPSMMFKTYDKWIFGVSKISKDGSDFKVSLVSTGEDENDIEGDFTSKEKYLNKIVSLKEEFRYVYDAMSSKDIDNELFPGVQYDEYISKYSFKEELNVDSLTLKNEDIIIDEDVLKTKILYYDNKPVLYYWKSDGYWYRYDYYNKKEPVTTKIDLDYIIDVKQFTYDTGETIPLFVDIEGNLKEFTE